MNHELLQAVEAARRFAQLVHYHDNHPHVNHNYGHKPHNAWIVFLQQFRTTGDFTVVCFAFANELRTLAISRRGLGHEQGQPPTATQEQ